MIQEFVESLSALLGIVGCVGQFLQVFNAGEGFRSSLLFQRTDIAAAIDQEANQFRQGRLVSLDAEPWHGLLRWRWWRCCRFGFHLLLRSTLGSCIQEGIEGNGVQRQFLWLRCWAQIKESLAAVVFCSEIKACVRRGFFF